MTDRLFDYAFQQLTPAERVEVEAYLRDHPEAVQLVARLQAALRPLEADRAHDLPPVDLVTNTLAGLAESLVVPKAKPLPRDWWLFNRRRVDVAVALSLGFISFGLLFGGISKLRERQSRVMCQDQLRGTHLALSGYAETHSGRYPEVGTEAIPHAGDFVAELVRTGHYESDKSGNCPSGKPIPYAYTLGYRATPFATVTGLRREGQEASSDWTPIAADLPSAELQLASGPTSPHGGGQNVLYIGGMVRFATTSFVGLQGDDIYRNDAGVVRAGLRSSDSTLGRLSDYP
jgi:hypothetical protein